MCRTWFWSAKGLEPMGPWKTPFPLKASIAQTALSCATALARNKTKQAALALTSIMCEAEQAVSRTFQSTIRHVTRPIVISVSDHTTVAYTDRARRVYARLHDNALGTNNTPWCSNQHATACVTIDPHKACVSTEIYAPQRHTTWSFTCLTARQYTQADAVTCIYGSKVLRTTSYSIGNAQV